MSVYKEGDAVVDCGNVVRDRHIYETNRFSRSLLGFQTECDEEIVWYSGVLFLVMCEASGNKDA